MTVELGGGRKGPVAARDARNHELRTIISTNFVHRAQLCGDGLCSVGLMFRYRLRENR
jgi:hypothetical protein